MNLALIELLPSLRNSEASALETFTGRTPTSGNPESRRANFVAEVRFAINELDTLLGALPASPADDARCPAALSDVSERLLALQTSLADTQYALTTRVVARAAALVSRLQRNATRWELMSKLAIEELVSVLDLLADVIELVGTDSGCRHEERVSLRILASVAPQVLADLDAMSFREIRFHQVTTNPHAATRVG